MLRARPNARGLHGMTVAEWRLVILWSCGSREPARCKRSTLQRSLCVWCLMIPRGAGRMQPQRRVPRGQVAPLRSSHVWQSAPGAVHKLKLVYSTMRVGRHGPGLYSGGEPSLLRRAGNCWRSSHAAHISSPLLVPTTISGTATYQRWARRAAWRFRVTLRADRPYWPYEDINMK